MCFDLDCSNVLTGNIVSDHFRWANFGVFGQFLLIINANEWRYRIQYGALFCCPFNCNGTGRLMIEFEQVFAEKEPFQFLHTNLPFLSLPIAAHFLKMTFTGGNPWPFYLPTNPFRMFAAFSGSRDIWFKSNFT